MATATIQVAYEAETSSLKATVNEINQINDKVVEGAQESAKKVKGFFANIANSFSSAFSGGEVKKTLGQPSQGNRQPWQVGQELDWQLRGLKQELAALETAGQEGTAAFNKLLISAARLEDQIGDTRDRVRILASDTFKFDAAVGATQVHRLQDSRLRKVQLHCLDQRAKTCRSHCLRCRRRLLLPMECSRLLHW